MSNKNSDIETAMATGFFLEQKKEETVSYLSDSLSKSFSLLANIEPSVAWDVLKQLNEQFTEKDYKNLSKSHEESLKKLADSINLDS